MGVGSTGVAALAAGRRFVGMEIDPAMRTPHRAARAIDGGGTGSGGADRP